MVSEVKLWKLFYNWENPFTVIDWEQARTRFRDFSIHIICMSHFRINDFLPFFIPLLLLNYFYFNLFLFLQKGEERPSVPPSARSLNV